MKQQQKRSKVNLRSVERKRYVAKELSYENGKHMISYMFILLKGRAFEVEDTSFTAFFMSKDILNLSIETKQKTYARIIVPFLNYILIDSLDRINDISELTWELANKFVTEYAAGEFDESRKVDGKPERRSPDTIEKCEFALTKFIKWLCYGRKHGIKMKHFERSRFGGNKTIFEVIKDKKESRKKLKNLSPYLVAQFIDVALEHDPMIALGISLQAFVGMRVGEICQMAEHRFVWTCNSWDFITDKTLLEELALHDGPASNLSAYINLEQEYVLRSDGKRAGGIKIHRKQPVFEPFLPIIRHSYYEHTKMLKAKGINNKYNALFINRDGAALLTASYLKRFDKVANLLYTRMSNLSKHNKLAAEALGLLKDAPLLTHSLRYFYTNQIGLYVTTPHLLAYYRGDRTLTAAMRYLERNPKIREFIQNVQDSFGDSYKQLTGQL